LSIFYQFSITFQRFYTLTLKSICVIQSDYENDPQNDQQPANKVPHTRTKEHKNRNNMGDSSDISQAISVLVNRLFPSTEDKALFQSLKEALASTRKYKKFSDSVILKQLQQWEKFPLQRIHTGIRTYLNKQCHLQGKDEKYLMGIIRNSTSDLINLNPERTINAH